MKRRVVIAAPAVQRTHSNQRIVELAPLPYHLCDVHKCRVIVGPLECLDIMEKTVCR